jgi:nucleoside-diphosphate-sugar epimerase
MNLLVTGGSGFIGKYLINELLKHDFEVKVLTRQKKLDIPKIKIVNGDITKIKDCLFALNNVDVVFHNAAYANDFGKKSEIFNTNINGTNNIVQACLKKGINRIIYTSTAGVYGFPNTKNKINEKSKIKPYNVYHKSKYEGERILKKNKDLKVSIIRPPLVLGAGGRGSNLLINKIREGKMVYIGDGDQYISIVHPSDVAQCLWLALEKDKIGDIFNTVSFYCRIKELFNEISKKLNVKSPDKKISYFFAYFTALLNERIYIKEPSLTRFRVKTLGTTRLISFDKARKIINYKPRYNLKMTVEDMVKKII